MNTTNTLPAPGEELECTIESMATGGMALARPEGYVAFIDQGLPGERVRIRVVETRKNHVRAELVERLGDSPDRVQPPCPHVDRCGGCQWQHLSHEGQLRWKQRMVVDSLSRLGGLGPEAETLVLETLASPKPFRYRNKMEFHFGPGPDGNVLLGLKERSSSRIVEPTDCMLMHEPGGGGDADRSALAMDVAAHVRELVSKGKLPAWSDRRGKGFWRFLVLRFFNEPSNTMAHFITGPSQRSTRVLNAVAGELLARCPGLSMVAHSVRSHPSQIAYGQGRVSCWNREGSCEPVQHETLLGLRVGVPVNGFMQVNTGAAELLFGTAVEWAAESGREPELIHDVFCGCGALTMALARRFPKARIAGFELSREAVATARDNVRSNGLDNVHFLSGDAGVNLPADKGAPDLVVIDPPRRGMDRELVELLLERRPSRILAISCDPATLARDVKRLSTGYSLAKALPVDLFPQSSHVETLALLGRR